jgi:hypothetical protein
VESIPEHELDLIRLATQKCGKIGSDTFRRTIEKKLGRSVALKLMGRPKKITRPPYKDLQPSSDRGKNG